MGKRRIHLQAKPFVNKLHSTLTLEKKKTLYLFQVRLARLGKVRHFPFGLFFVCLSICLSLCQVAYLSPCIQSFILCICLSVYCLSVFLWDQSNLTEKNRKKTWDFLVLFFSTPPQINYGFLYHFVPRKIMFYG